MRNQDVQDVVAALLTAWQRYKLKNDNEAEIDQWMDMLATRTDVEMFGNIGQIVSFKPFEHFPTKRVIGKNVQIIALGVRAIREDSSHRVLTKAIVKPL